MNKRSMLAAAVALFSEAAAAQSGRRQGGERQGRPREKQDGEPRPDLLEVTLHELEEDLKLTTEQRPAWDAYAGKVRALAGDVVRERQQRPAPDLALERRINRLVDAARDRLTAVEDIGEAAKALYAKLAPDQQSAANPRLATVMTMPLLQPPPEAAGGRPPRP